MSLRRTLGLALLTTSTSLLAQVPTPTPEATPAPATTPAEAPKQDPDKPQPTAADRIAELERERERLTKEIEFARERVAKAGQTLKDKFANRKLAVKAINAGTSVAAPTPVAAPRAARLMSADEASRNGDALVVVNGRGITKSQVEGLVEYQRSYPSSGTDELRMQRAMLEVIRTEATLASFAEPAAAAEKSIGDLRAEVEKGAAIGEIAKTKSQGAAAQEGGQIEVTRNSFHGLELERVAFATKEGQLSPVFKTPMGFAFLKVDAFEKGENADMDKVKATLIQLNYFTDANEMRQVQSAVATGQLDIAVKDDGVMQMLPMMFRPQAPVPLDQKVDEGAPVEKVKSIEELKKEKLEAIEKAKKEQAEKKG